MRISSIKFVGPGRRLRKVTGQVISNDGDLILASGDCSITPTGGNQALVVRGGRCQINLHQGWGNVRIYGIKESDKLNLTHQNGQRLDDYNVNWIKPVISDATQYNMEYGFGDTAKFRGAFSSRNFLLPTPTFPPLFPIRGYAHVSFVSLDLPESVAWLQKQKALGATWTRIIAWWAMDSDTSNSVHSHPGITMPDEEIIFTIRAAQSLGMNVLLTPAMIFLDGSNTFNLDPTDKNAWFASYTAFLQHYAAIAAQTAVQMFTIGGELQLLQDATYTSNWESLIAGVRSFYPGMLVYSTVTTDPADVAGVMPQVDIVGFQAYFSLSENIPELDQGALITAWAPLFAEMQALAQGLGKAWFIHELGYESQTDCAKFPFGSASNETSEEAQNACYAAVLRSSKIYTDPFWFKGILFWSGGPARGVVSIQDFIPFGKLTAFSINSEWDLGIIA